MTVMAAAPTAPASRVRGGGAAKGGGGASSKAAPVKKAFRAAPTNGLSVFGNTMEVTLRNKKERRCHYCQRVGHCFGPNCPELQKGLCGDASTAVIQPCGIYRSARRECRSAGSQSSDSRHWQSRLLLLSRLGVRLWVDVDGLVSSS